MLWSLLKLLAFVAVVAGLTIGGAYLMEQGGGAVIAMGGYEVSLTPLQLAIGVLLLVAVVWVLLKLLGLLGAVLRFVNGDNNALSRHFSRRRERKGLEALTDAAVALASGEGKAALARATQANRYLDQPELTQVLIAQAAEMTGDTARAEETYKLLARHERTRFAGIRGLLRQRLAQGDDVTALRLAERAFELNPRHAETQDVLLRLQAESHDWAGARRTLGAQLKSGALPRDVHKRRDAVLALSQAADVIDDSKSIEAREAAIEANRLSPDLIPAAVMAARGYIAAHNGRYAARVLRKAWDVQPHPDLAAAFAEIVPEESPQERLRRFQALTSLRPEHPETRMLLAELLIAAEDFAGARRALGDLPETQPTGRNLTLMAAIARGQGEDEATVRGWLTRALAAPRGPQWVCDNCGRIHPQWVPVCANCHAFDTLSWKTPPAEASLPGGVEMLPLLVRDGAGPSRASSGPEDSDATEARIPASAPPS
ncbi:putative HemY protein [Rubellimicrobium mesophilum DSM 19309]|uniref:Putative HemY protein n=1 Tax=Rubellimicrobium mesophilum DSM 19309 TaxID=442562 RepID=A0A017HK87_9RHOB|nr:heme biosynthesis HemY N-terminal domain-containing protein [Rubellimicrobium mesophilum]EYD74189.1 putative HemY protein [Rubellimicrobium mesophilum DSM 19309]